MDWTKLHLDSGTKPAEVAASVRSYVARWALRYWDGVTPVWRLKSRIRLHGVVWGILGVGLGAFFVTYALTGRAGVADLARRSVRWRVPLRWYLITLLTVPVGATLVSLVIFGADAVAAPPGGWPRALDPRTKTVNQPPERPAG